MWLCEAGSLRTAAGKALRRRGPVLRLWRFEGAKKGVFLSQMGARPWERKEAKLEGDSALVVTAVAAAAVVAVGGAVELAAAVVASLESGVTP